MKVVCVWGGLCDDWDMSEDCGESWCVCVCVSGVGGDVGGWIGCDINHSGVMMWVWGVWSVVWGWWLVV